MLNPTTRAILPCLAAVLIDVLGVGLALPVLTAYFTGSSSSTITNHGGFFALGLAFALYPLGMLLGSPVLSGLSDSWGRKKVLGLCVIGLALGFVTIGAGISLENLSLILVGRLFSGLMAASMPIALAAVADLSTVEEKSGRMSLVALVQGTGFIIGPFLGGVLADSTLVNWFSSATPFYLSGAAAGAVWLWLWLAFQNPRSPAQNIATTGSGLSRWLESLKQPRLQLLCGVFFLMQMSVAIYMQTILIEFEQLFDYRALQLGIFTGFLGVWFAVGLLAFVPWLARRFCSERSACVAIGLLTLSYAVTALIMNQPGLWLAGALMGLTAQTAYANLFASFSNAASATNQGLVMGLASATLAVAFFLSGLTPALIPVVGTRWLLGATALLGFLAYLGMHWGIPRTAQKQQ